jgi:hypothetical protein
MPVQIETFSPGASDPDHAFLFTLVPLYAPTLQVVLTNTGSEPARTFNSWVYGVRFVSPV